MYESVLFIGAATLLCLLLFIWWKRSYRGYEPNQGWKFEPPPTYLYPFKHRWISFDIDNDEMQHVNDPQDTKLPCIHYIDEGREKQNDKNDICFLMFHGNPTWSFLYRKIIQNISTKHRCIAIDCPGFGLSTAPKQYSFSTHQQAKILLSVITKLNLNNMVLIQQDWGGPTGFYVALHSKATIKGFVIGNTWCWRVNALQRPDIYAFSKIFGGFIGRSLGFGFNFVIRSFFREGFYKKLNKEIRYWYDVPFKKKNSRHGTWIWPAQVFMAGPLLKEIEAGIPLQYGKSTPCLLCWGSNDIAFKRRELERFKSIFMDHTVIDLKQSSHFWQEDQGNEASEHILKWVENKFA